MLALQKFEASASSATTIRDAWHRADLSYKLRTAQKQMHRGILDARSLKYVLNCARRLGKSFYLSTLAIMTSLRERNRIVRYGAPTQKMMRNITRPLMREILLDAPAELRPRWDTMDSCYRFHNGSEIHISGCNNGHAENLRGSMAHLIILDEAGIIDDLKYVVNDILMPQLLTTGGKLVMASTPPRTPAHDFTELAQAARVDGAYSEFNIYHAEYEPTLISEFQKEAGGPTSTTWRREYMCQFVVDENFAIIPEWDDKYIQEPPRDRFYPYYQKYNFMDLGVRDLNVNLLGYYDFKRATLFIEDEIVVNGPQMTTDLVAKLNKAKEKELWGDAQPYVRVADNDNPLMLQDMAALHGIHFRATDKDRLEAMVNNVRILVGAGRIIVSPKCKQLIGCLQFGVWKETRTEFDRSSVYGHFDAISALVYGCRALDQVTNPIPPNLDLSEATHFIPDPKFTDEANQIRKIFGARR